MQPASYLRRRPLRGVVLALGLAWSLSLINPTAGYAGHVACGMTLTVSTQLDSDLVCGPGDGLVIGADGITLDLKGHTVRGGGPFVGGAGVRVARHQLVEIKNGVLENFGEGVVLDEATNSHVMGLTLRGNLRGINLAGANNNLVEKNVATASFLDGIRLGLSAGNRIEKNVVSDNVFGIAVADFSGLFGANHVAQNEVRRNFAFGIAVFSDSDGNQILQNLVTDNVFIGITVQSGSDNTRLGQNKVAGNGVATASDGIFVEISTTGTLVERNEASANGDDGIDTDSSLTTLRKNEVSGNVDLGIEAPGGVIDGGGNEASGNGNPAQCTGVVCTP